MNSTKEKQNSGASLELVEGRIWKGIFRMSCPMLLIMIFNFAVGFTDIYVAGLLGPEVQAAVGFIEQLYFLLIVLGNAVSIGSVAIISRAIGSENMEEAKTASRQALGFGLIIAVILTCAGLLLPRLIVSAAGLPAEIFEMAIVFFRIFSISLGFNYFLIISSAILRALGTPEKPLVSMAIMAGLNVLLDFALVFGWYPFPPMGYTGIAVATAISIIGATAINIFFLLRLNWTSFYRSLLKLSRDYVWRIISVSWPMAMVLIAWNAGNVVLYNILAHLKEAHIASMAAYANGVRIEAIIFMPAFAMNMAASVLVGQNLGAGKGKRASRIGWQISLTSAAALGIAATILYLFAPEVSAILAKDAAVLDETITYLRYNLLVAPLTALTLTLSGGLQGAGDTLGVMIVILIGMWLTRLPLAYLLGVHWDWGASGVWAAMILSMILLSILMALRFHLGKWKRLKV